MIGAVSSFGSYAGVQWSSYAAPVRNSTFTAAKNPSVIAVQRASSPETAVQPVDAATPVTSEVSGNLNIDLSVRNSADVTEMSVRMRISSAESSESTQTATLPGAQKSEVNAQENGVQGSGAKNETQEIGVPDDRMAESSAVSEDAQDALEAEKAERQAWLEERAQLEQEAEAQREAYLESLAETEQTRSERVEALREAQAEDGESTDSPVGKEDEETRQSGSLELDRTASLLQNYQMTNLLQAQISARMNGEDTAHYDAALDAMIQNGQDRVRFINNSEETSNTRQAYQQHMNNSPLGIVA